MLLAAGAPASPAIAQRTELGPAQLLRDVGVTVIEDRPGVGANLREHRELVKQWKARDSLSFNAGHVGIRMIGNASTI